MTLTKMRCMSSWAGRVDRPIDPARDHVSEADAVAVELVEYGDYECPHCRAAHNGVRNTRERLGGRLRYVFRHLPNAKLHPRAELAAEAAEAAAAQGKFWEMHDALFTEQRPLDRNVLLEIAASLGLDIERFVADIDDHRFAERVQEDLESAILSGAHGTPTFFVNGRRYDGAWDEDALREAIDEPFGFRVRRLSQDFVALPASGGAMLLAGTLIAMLWANSPWAHFYEELWETELSLRLGSSAMVLPLREWINQGLMAIFFFVIGLEVKRELAVGELASRRRAALPVGAALGGLIVPAAIYALANGGGPAAHGWGIPMSTDTAFALGLLALLGSRIPFSLKIFVAALAIADDVGAILVITVFYAADLSSAALAIAACLYFAACALNRARVYRALPYALLGICLWVAVLYSGIHATIAGVLLAMVIPTRSPPATSGLLDQSIGAFRSLEAPLQARRQDESHYQTVVRTLETVVERLLSPAQRLERDLQPWSSYFVLPLLALANAGIPLRLSPEVLLSPMSLGIAAGLIVGKPLGIVLASWAVVKAGIGDLPPDIDWRTLTGAACLCGVGFTMSIFIATAAFADPEMLMSAKLSVIAASVIAGTLGWVLLRRAIPAGS
jgi:NhaA family Na+:H+ antiporter